MATITVGEVLVPVAHDTQVLCTTGDHSAERHPSQLRTQVLLPGTQKRGVFDELKENILSFFSKSWFCSCVEPEDLEALRRDRAYRHNVSVAEHLLPLVHSNEDVAVTAARQAFLHDGYDMLDFEVQERMNARDDHPVAIPVAGMVRYGRKSPHFVAQMVLGLRARLGRLEATPANVLVVGRDYRRMCDLGRSMNVQFRSYDIAIHEQAVINAFFSTIPGESDDLVRTRVPKWVARLFGQDTAVPAPLAC